MKRQSLKAFISTALAVYILASSPPLCADQACRDVFNEVIRYKAYGLLAAPGLKISKVDPPVYAPDGRISSQSWYDQSGEPYPRTGRTLAKVEKDFFSHQELSSENIRGLRILDAGTGTGRLVEDLLEKSQREGLNLHVEGIDLVISESMYSSGHFRAMDMRRTSYKDGEWDMIISIASIFTHGPHEFRDIVGDGLRGHPNYGKRSKVTNTALREVLKEYKRICSPGCVVLIADVSPSVEKLAQMVGFKTKHYGNNILRLHL